MKENGKNLWLAFSGETMARSCYYFYAEVARQEGYEQMEDVLT